MTKPIPGRIFKLVAGHPGLDFVNTLDWRFRPGEREELLESYGDVLDFVEQSRLLTAKQSRELRRKTSAIAGDRVLAECEELREALADVIYAQLDGRRPGLASMKTLERSFQTARRRQNLAWSEPRFHWDWAGAEALPEFPFLLLARAASGLMLSEDFQKVRACDNPECRWLFLDTSKNRTRRWCDMKLCGNRMKARRFKAQHRE
ncbi:MAG: CGNR zinc finger domain-containing protein [Terracidiphilus sp.]